MENRLDALFKAKAAGILNMYCTAGFPELDSTSEVILALQQAGADIVEVGIPYSDPIADGTVIQQSNMQAISNGMQLPVLFNQLRDIRQDVQIPLILMGYLNPVLQYGMEKFCADAAAAGVDGIILPDLPLYEFETMYRPLFIRHQLHFIFLVTPETSEERIRKIDTVSGGFIYAVSSSSTTGAGNSMPGTDAYLQKLRNLKLSNPFLVGFGISDSKSFLSACKYAQGAIIGSAYINAIKDSVDIKTTTKEFINTIKGGPVLPNSK